MGTQLPGGRSSGFFPPRELPNGCTVRVIAGAQSWIEGEAVDQLEKTGARFGMKLAIGLPDLHPGRGHPIGAAFVSDYAAWPTLVGNDIGCGMALFRTTLPSHWREHDRWARRLQTIERPLDEEFLTGLSPETEAAGWRHALGTIGGGNHFAELLSVDEAIDEAEFSKLGLEKKKLVVLVHSGSRGLGDSILQAHVREHGDKPLLHGSYELQNYVVRHNQAVAWARDNRRLIGERFLRALRTDGERVLDLVHNSVTNKNAETRFLHRKGAAPADAGVVVIPGSRGDFSHLVKPTALAAETDLSAWSLAHGAGRRWRRSDCKGRLDAKHTAESLERTPLGSRVICTDRKLIFEEAPQAYKDVETVVDDLFAAGLVTEIAQLKPVLTFKTAKQSHHGED